MTHLINLSGGLGVGKSYSVITSVNNSWLSQSGEEGIHLVLGAAVASIHELPRETVRKFLRVLILRDLGYENGPKKPHSAVLYSLLDPIRKPFGDFPNSF
jgi:hypothetical protein